MIIKKCTQEFKFSTLLLTLSFGLDQLNFFMFSVINNNINVILNNKVSYGI